MRKLLLALTLIALTGTATIAEDTKAAKIEKKEAPKKKAAPQKPKLEITLRTGDAAPALKADKWMLGDEVKSFESGKVYVVEFWATWCGPCIVMMPHLGDLQEKFKNKGVTVVGYSAKDPNNSEEKVATFVQKRGPKLGYTFAFSEDRDTYKSWMTAAGRNGIPCSFVVDKSGKLAYIGHPMYLDVVLPRVVSGEWKTKEDNEKIEGLEKEVSAMFAKIRGKDGLQALEEFEAKHPEMTEIPYFLGPKLTKLVEAGKTKEASKMAKSMIAKAGKRDDTMALRSVSAALRTCATSDKEDVKALFSHATEAAEKMVQLAGDKDYGALSNLAETYLATKTDEGKEKGLRIMKQAIEAAPSPAIKKMLQNRMDTLNGKPKDKD
ncbi:MAG: TlpA disulfide reductase family protein [Gemmataceae bacterium]